jgi:hypothetical protein
MTKDVLNVVFRAHPILKIALVQLKLPIKHARLHGWMVFRHWPRRDEDRPLRALVVRIVIILFRLKCHWRASHGMSLGLHPASIMVFFVCPAVLFDLDRSDLPSPKYCTKPVVPGNDSSKSHWVITMFTMYDIFYGSMDQSLE